MKRTHKLVLSVALIVGAAIVTAGVAGAQVATMSYGSSSVAWSPTIENEGMILTVSGNGRYFRREFSAGEPPSFSIFDNEGELLPDGYYNWELTATPTRAAIERSTASLGRTSASGDYQRDASLLAPLIESGTFQIANGAIVDPALFEADAGAPAGGIGGLGGGGGKGANVVGDGPVTNVVLTNADGVIRNSACVGFDCPNSPSFSDTTVLLVENNTRIKFDDTSSLAGFPNNDWELQANSGSSGGGNFFAINDCGTGSGGGCPDSPLFKVTAGAPTNSLFVSSAGRLGIRTGVPVLELHIKDGDTPSIRLEQDNSSGFTPQTWDLAGNETNFFIRDATNGSALPFRIQPGTAGNTLFLDADDRVGIGGETTVEKPLHVRGTILSDPDDATVGGATPNLYLLRSGSTTTNIRFENGNRTWFFQNEGASGDFQIRDATGSATPFVIEAGAPALSLELRTTGVFIEGGTPLPDFVFDPDYELESIEDHAAYMWENKHLPAVGPAPVSPETGRTKINVLAHSAGMLEELEKAHIYIEQLHGELSRLSEEGQRKDGQLAQLEARLAELEAGLRDLARDE